MKNGLLPFLILCSSLLAEECCPTDECFSTCSCCPIDHSAFLRLKHREPGGIGYPRGYTSLELFSVQSYGENTYGFFDGRGHLFNDGKWATNLGLGIRHLDGCSDVISGYNIYWDWVEAERGNFHQIGLGGELLWTCFDLQLNGHIPVGKRRKGHVRFDKFEGHSAFFAKKYSLNMGGFDAQIGYWPYKSDCFATYFALGGYYFQGNFHTHFGGGFAQAKVSFWDYVEVEGQVSYDNEFKWIGQGQLALTIPFGPTLTRYPRKTHCCEDYLTFEERLLERPNRFEIAVTVPKKRKERARHPVTRRPLTFYFVDNTSSSNGTIESPFPTIGQATTASQMEDALYVFPGDGSGYDETIILQNQQLLGGSGAPFWVSNGFGSKGNIPKQTQERPLMFGAGSKVTIQSGNRITGMRLVSSDTYAIEAMTAIHDFSARHNQLEGNVVGILLNEPFTGTFFASDNQIVSVTNNAISFFNNTTFDGTLIAKRNTIDAKENGIAFFKPFMGTFDASGNVITTEQGTGIFVSDPFTGSFRASGNTINTFGIGIFFEGTFTGTFTASNNQMRSQNATGIGFLNLAKGQLSFENNHIVTSKIAVAIENLGDGALLVRNNTVIQQETTDSTFDVKVSGNTSGIIHNNLIGNAAATAPGFIWTQTGGSGRIEFADNTSLSSAPPATKFDGSAAPLEVESPNLKLSGVQAINEGVIEADSVTFVEM